MYLLVSTFCVLNFCAMQFTEKVDTQIATAGGLSHKTGVLLINLPLFYWMRACSKRDISNLHKILKWLKTHATVWNGFIHILFSVVGYTFVSCKPKRQRLWYFSMYLPLHVYAEFEQKRKVEEFELLKIFKLIFLFFKPCGFSLF